MDIISISYAGHENKSMVEVKLKEILTPDVEKRSESYFISLEGRYELSSETLYDDLLNKLSQAGVNVLPF